MNLYLVVIGYKGKMFLLYLNARDSIEVKQFCDLVKCDTIAYAKV